VNPVLHPVLQLQQQAGNQAVQELLRCGAIQAKLAISNPGDPEEEEADRVAEHVMRADEGHAFGAPCPCMSSGGEMCEECKQKQATIHRRATGTGAPSVAPRIVGEVLQSPGHPLDAATRAFMEPRFGQDFSRVRLHTGAEAAGSARAINALAFTAGKDIVFGSEQYSPDSNCGRRLLAHELAHVVQGGKTIRRDPNQSSIDDNASYQPPPEPMTSSSQGPAKIDHDSGFDPCAVDVQTLTNYLLLAEYSNATKVVDQGRNAAGFFDYRNLQRRLEIESGRRVKMGHAWLSSMPSEIPPSLFKLVEGLDGTITVVNVPGVVASGMPAETTESPLLTADQFQNFLITNNVETIDSETYRLRIDSANAAQTASTGVASSRSYNTSLDRSLMDPFAKSATSNKWTGRLGEAGYESRLDSGNGLFLEDLNARSWIDRTGRLQSPRSEAYPSFDFERLAGTPGFKILGAVRVSSKMSLQPNQGDRFAYFRKGMADMLEAPSSVSALSTYIANDPQFGTGGTNAVPYDIARQQVLADSYLAINDDDVASFRRLLSDPTLRESPQATNTVWNDVGQRRQGGRPVTGWRSVLEGIMRDNPVTIDTVAGTRTFNSPAALDQARAGNQITQEQHVNAQREVGRRAALRVVSNKLDTAGGGALRGARGGISLPEAGLRPLMTPEYIRAHRLGGGFSGEMEAGAGAGLQGAGLGGLIAVLTTSGIILIDEHRLPNWRELGTSGGLGALGSGSGALTEQMLISLGTQRAIQSAAAGGVSSLTPGLSTGLGRFGGGGVGAAVVEAASMGLLEERSHSGLEKTVRIGRAFVLGGTSAAIGGAVGAAVAGAVAGSFVPVVGTVVGLLAGAATYYFLDKLTPGGRADWDGKEAGCQPKAAAPSSVDAEEIESTEGY
jgi:hypothetical protein